MKKFFQQMFKGINGDDVSSKRVITFLAFLCIVLAFMCNVFMDIPLQEHIYDGMLYLVVAGMGFSSFEKFSPSKNIDNGDRDEQHS